ncbi:uncharacterized protein LOC128873840 [Hylaeus volcanicus]|uniref:uncharacterized protein LOC128873840 n=1 Tax=Hylaeus volcanicus TaxID=313075 RepID=UPI0023B873BA|nr:uncharacterized protein LOC128873840 [Hylaeus volcanicus]
MASVSGHECVDPFRKLIDLHTTYLRSCGLWQISPSNSRFLRWAYFGCKILMLTTMYVFMMTIFADIWSNIDNMAITTDGGCILAGMVVVTFKAMHYQIRRGKIMRLLDDTFKCADDLCEFSNIDCIRDITKKYHLRNQIILHGFSGVGFILAIALLFFSPMEDGLPIRAMYPFDTTTSPWRLVGFAVEAVAVSGGLIAIVSMDSLMTLICSMLSMLFDILNVNFENRIEQVSNTVCKVRNHDDTSYIVKKADDSFLRRYKKCLRFHQRLVVATNDFNKTYSLSMFVQMLSSTSIICLTCFQAIVNAVGKMRLLVLVLAGCLNVLEITRCQELSVIRHSDGDIFTLEGSCTEACAVLSSGTASPYTRSPSTAGLVHPNNTCTCQCNYGLPTFREDLHICVNDIHECNVAGFVSSTGQVERVPYVFLPQRGQIIYPHAEIRFEGVTTPVCGVAGAQQLGRTGWLELRNISDTEPPFRLFRDEGRTFLLWIGEAGLKEAAEGRVVTAKLVCRDASSKSKLPIVFTPCVAFRVAGSPSKSNVREVTFSSTTQLTQGLSTTEYTAIGLSSVILALIYIASVSLYLHSKKARRKIIEEPELNLSPGREVSGLVKNNPLLAASRHFESDANSGLTESDLGDELPASDGEQGFENVTSAVIHPHCVYLEQSELCFGSGSILGERIPEEDVRVVETAENPHQQDIPVLPGAQRRKLYFNPAYFDRQLLLAPPPAAIEFLLKIREVISIAKHKMAAKRYVPTLNGIPEEENSSDRCDSTGKNQQRSSPSSVQGSTAKSRKSQRCTGCPGCTDSFTATSTLPETDLPNPGESKVRAWLEDVRTPQRRWRDTEETRRNFQENTSSFAKNLEYLKELAKRDFDSEGRNPKGMALYAWKDNTTLKSYHQTARSEIITPDDRHSISKRSTKSMFEETNCYRENGDSSGSSGDDALNAKVRRTIENSFIEQMEENGIVERKEDQGNTSPKTPLEDKETEKIEAGSNSSQRSTKKSNEGSTRTKKELPDMINELPNANNTAKRIMDAVIREMVGTKVLEQQSKSGNMDYEVDSLERSKSSRKSSTSPISTDQSSPALSTALPMDEELTMQNAVINTRTGEMTISKLNKDVLERNYYNSLPELISSQRSESYSLVSEVYVNDGYDSPACSDDSGPEIQYEPENPGHLTIKVQDSPDNYVKQDESEYEPDTLDRKPMKLKINDDVNYEKEVPDEVYVDSLERPAQILLKSKGSFRDQTSVKSDTGLQRGYGSLREIYEARIKSSMRDSSLTNSTNSLNDHLEDTMSWKMCKYLTPDNRQAKRQRQPSNQPDVVPMPPTEDIYQHPKPPRRVKDLIPSTNCQKTSSLSKNGWDRSPAEAGDPTTSNGAPVPSDHSNVGTTDPCSCEPSLDVHVRNSVRGKWKTEFEQRTHPGDSGDCKQRFSTCWKDTRQEDKRRLLCQCHLGDRGLENSRQNPQRRRQELRSCTRGQPRMSRSCESMTNPMCRVPGYHQFQGKVEDSGYLSSTDSNGSQKRLLGHEVSSVSETDETESVCDGASESGAESVGTDSVFFGNFRRLSAFTSFPKSMDSGVDICPRNAYIQPLIVRNENVERTNFSTSDSETESFITVLPPRETIREPI